MIVNFFLIFCVLLFCLISIYTLITIIIKKDLIDFRKILKTLNDFSLIPLILLIICGFLGFTFYFVINTDFYKNSIKLITNSEGLGSFGDFFNGLIAPIISAISIIYLYKAFIQQFRANEMLYNFEFEKNIKEDLDWLRDNNNFVRNIVTEINNKDINELQEYLIKETININKLIYTINLFNKIFEQTSKEKNSDLKQKTIMILNSFFLNDYESIFRDLKDFMINNYEIDNSYFEKNLIELIFSRELIKLHSNLNDIYKDSPFNFTINEIKKHLK